MAFVAVVLLAIIVVIVTVAMVKRRIVEMRNRRITDYDIIDMQGCKHKGFFSDPSVFHSITGEVFVKVGPADDDWERVE